MVVWVVQQPLAVPLYEMSPIPKIEMVLGWMIWQYPFVVLSTQGPLVPKVTVREGGCRRP